MGRKIPEQCRKENTLKQPEPQQPEDAEGSLRAPKPRGMCEAMRPYWRWQSENETLEEFLEQRRAGKTRGQATSLAKSPKERREKGRRRLAVDAWRMSIHGNREDTINNAARLAKDEKREPKESYTASALATRLRKTIAEPLDCHRHFPTRPVHHPFRWSRQHSLDQNRTQQHCRR